MSPDVLNTFLDEIADRLVQRYADELRQVVHDAIADATKDVAPASTSGREVMGIDPYALYTVSFLAKRWSYEREQSVRDLDQGLLPRAEWMGSGIRYRGIDILRYEGASSEVLQPTNVVPMRPSRPAAHKTATRETRIKAKLPEL